MLDVLQCCLLLSIREKQKCNMKNGKERGDAQYKKIYKTLTIDVSIF